MHFSRENFDQLLETCATQRTENSQLKTEVQLLQEKVQYLLKKLFGRSSEKLNPDQMELLLEELRDAHDALEELDEEPEKLEEQDSKRGKRKPLSERVPADLPIEEVVIIPDEVLANPALFKKVGEETLEELDVTPTRFFKRIIIREKYVRINDRAAPPRDCSRPG